MKQQPIHVAAKNLWRLIHGRKIVHVGRIDPKKSAIILVNHQSMSEPTVTYGTLTELFKRPVVYLCMDKVFNWPIVGGLIKKLGFIPVARGTKNAANSIELANKYLCGSDRPILCIYPEGNILKGRSTMSPQKFKSGAARIIVTNPDANVHILTENGSRPGKRQLLRSFLTHSRITMSLSDPLTIDEDFYHWGLDHDNIKSLTLYLERSMAQEYEDLMEKHH